MYLLVMRGTFAAALLFGLGGAGILLAIAFVAKWDEDSELSRGFFLEIAVVPFVIGLAALLAGAWLLFRDWRNRPRKR
jgi:hypothetical protein